MNTPIIITPFDILVTLLIITGFAALVFLIICLYRLFKILGKVNKFVDANNAPLTSSIKLLPEITENVSAVSKNMVGITESAGDIVDGLDEIAGTATLSDGGFLGTVTVIATLIQNIIQVVKNLTGKEE